VTTNYICWATMHMACIWSMCTCGACVYSSW